MTQRRKQNVCCGFEKASIRVCVFQARRMQSCPREEAASKTTDIQRIREAVRLTCLTIVMQIVQMFKTHPHPHARTFGLFIGTFQHRGNIAGTRTSTVGCLHSIQRWFVSLSGKVRVRFEKFTCPGITSLGTELIPKVRGSLDWTHQPCKRSKRRRSSCKVRSKIANKTCG